MDVKQRGRCDKNRLFSCRSSRCSHRQNISEAQIYSICKLEATKDARQKDELFLDSSKIALRYIIDGDAYEYIYNARGPHVTLPDEETSWLLQSLAVPQLRTQQQLFLKPILHISI